MTLPVFFASCAGLATLEPAQPILGQTVVWSGSEAHHACVVQRIGIGQQLELIDGRGARYVATVSSAVEGKRDNARVCLHIDSVSVEQPHATQLVLVQALAKGQRDEQSIEMATEIGISAVVPWMAGRCIVKWDGKKKDKGLAKWRNICQAATKQARRSFGVEVEDPVDTPDLAAMVAEAVDAGDDVILLYEEATDKFADYIRQRRTPSRIWIIVGPEGGIAPEEASMLREAGARPLKLGSTIMRVSSAGCAALANVAVAAGHWD